MNKADLITEMAKKSGLHKSVCANALDAFMGCVQDTLKKGDKVALTGFGTFEAKERKAREGINPRTKETVKIPASKAPAFKAGKTLKDAIN